MRGALLVNVLVPALALFALGGCAIPRSIVMRSVADDEIPLIPGGQKIFTKVDPSVESWPRAEVHIFTRQDLATVKEWYKVELRQRGWGAKIAGEQDPLDGDGKSNGRGVYYNIYRHGRPAITYEYIWVCFYIQPDRAGSEPGTRIEIAFDRWYARDWPSKEADKVVYWGSYMFALLLYPYGPHDAVFEVSKAVRGLF